MASGAPIGGALAAGPASPATMRLDAAATFRNTLAMLAELVAATLMVLLTVLIHGTGIYGLGRAFQRHYVQHHALHTHPLAPRTLALSLALMVGLFALHGVEIWTYAAFFLAVDALLQRLELVVAARRSAFELGHARALLLELLQDQRQLAAPVGKQPGEPISKALDRCGRFGHVERTTWNSACYAAGFGGGLR